MSVGKTVEGDLTTYDDGDLYSFEVESGRWYQVNVTLGTLGDSWLTLYDSDGRTISENDNAGSWASRIVWQAPSSGKRYIGVRSAHELDSGSYTVTISLPDITDNNANERMDATTIEIGKTAEAAVDYQGDADFFQFQAENGGIYDIVLASGTLARPVAVLYDPDGEWLESIRWYGDGSRFTWKAPQSGSYYIEVEADYFVETGSYTLAVALSDIVDDHGDSAADATAVTLGRSVEGSVDYDIDVDCFRFHAQTGQFYRIDVTLGTLSLAELLLSKPNGDVLSRDSSFGPWIIWQATNSGEHYVRVGSVAPGMISDYFGLYPTGPPCEVGYEAPGQGGSYTLTVSPIDITDDHSNYRTSATLISPGRFVEASIEYERDVDLFRFRGEADKLYMIYLVLGTLEDASIFLGNADGEGLTNTYGDSPSLRLDWHARSAGDYYVTVTDYVKGTGAYTLIVTQTDITDEHANDTEDATSLALGEAVEGSIAYQGDRDFFRFHATKGHYYLGSVDISVQPYENSSEL